MNNSESGGDRPQRSRGINPEKLQNLDQTKKIPIFYKSEQGTSEFLYHKFPREGLILFSDRCRRGFLDSEWTYVLIPNNNIAPYRAIFDWILECVNSGSIVDFETSDEYSPGVFTRLADIVSAAEFYELPARDVEEKVIKRMKGMARMQREQDRRVTFDELEDFYENRREDLAKISSSTVFFSWWYSHLDSEDTPDEMCELSALRTDYPELDQDLHDHVSDHDEFLKAKKQKREAEQMESGDSGYGSGAVGGGWDAGDNGANNAAAGGWNTDTSVAAPAGDWNTGAETGATGDWNTGAETGAAGGWNSGVDDGQSSSNVFEGADKENVAPATGGMSWDQGGEGNDWADEVNDSAQPAASW